MPKRTQQKRSGKAKNKDYYEGNHSILKSYQMQDSRSNMRLVFNFPRKFVDNETGYILGTKPVNYISKSDESTIITAIDIGLIILTCDMVVTEASDDLNAGIANRWPRCFHECIVK